MDPTSDELRAFAAQHLGQDAPEIPAELPPNPEINKGPPRKVCVALLAYDSRGFWRTFMSLMQAVTKCAERGWGFTYILREGDSMVARGRSLLASQFLTNPGCQDCTDLFFVDVDLAWDGDEFVRLMEHPVDVVGGAYPYKNDGGNFPLRWGFGGVMEQNGLWEVQAVTPGFLRITRAALTKMVHELPWMEFKDTDVGDGGRCWMFFDNLHRHNGIYDEGYVFCERWRMVGGRVWIDPDVVLSHIGLRIYQHGTLRQWLDLKSKQTAELHSEFPHIPPLRLFQGAVPINPTIGEAMKAKTEALKADLAREEAAAVERGDPAVVLSDPRYPVNAGAAGAIAAFTAVQEKAAEAVAS